MARLIIGWLLLGSLLLIASSAEAADIAAAENDAEVADKLKRSPSCPEKCKPKKCPKINKEDCTWGLTTDFCDCCKECAKGPGESCGGYWEWTGSCAKGLTCTYEATEGTPDYYEYYDSMTGICTVTNNFCKCGLPWKKLKN